MSDHYPANDYKITSFKGGEFIDRNGNAWYNCAFEGVSEPVTWVLKPETAAKTQVGDSVYGEIRLWKSAAGKENLRFYRLQRPDANHAESKPLPSGTPKSNWVPKDEESIKRQWAFGRAYEVVKPKTHEDWLKVKSDGDKLIQLVNSGSQRGVSATPPSTTATNEGKSHPAASDDNVDAEWASLMERGLEADEVNLNEIPF